MGESGGSFTCGVYRGGVGHVAGCWEKLHSVGNEFSRCCRDIDALTPVVLLGAAKVPAVDAMWCPCSVGAGIFMDEDSRTGRREWGFVVVEGTVKLGFGGQSRVDS